MGDMCDDPAGCHLGWSGPTNPPQKEQCSKAVHTVLRTRLGVQRPEAPTTNEVVLTACQVLTLRVGETLRVEYLRNAECLLYEHL